MPETTPRDQDPPADPPFLIVTNPGKADVFHNPTSEQWAHLRDVTRNPDATLLARIRDSTREPGEFPWPSPAEQARPDAPLVSRLAYSATLFACVGAYYACRRLFRARRR
jgi:hypothetical protein